MEDIELPQKDIDCINQYKSIIFKKDIHIKLRTIGFFSLLFLGDLYLILNNNELIKNDFIFIIMLILLANIAICLMMTLTIFKDGEKMSLAPFSYSILNNDRIFNKKFRFVKRCFQSKRYYMLIFDSNYKYIVSEIEMRGDRIPIGWIMNNIEYTTDNYNRYKLNKQL